MSEQRRSAGQGASLAGCTHTTVDSPIGPIRLLARDGVLSALHLEVTRYPPPPESFGRADPAGFTAVAEQLDAYFAGDLTEFDLPLAPAGTPFQHQVWAALRQIPYGTTESYGALAKRIGSPGAARAVGLANGSNPISIVVPCHRVIGSNGSLTGYGGGVERKQFLLDLERRVSGSVLF